MNNGNILKNLAELSERSDLLDEERNICISVFAEDLIGKHQDLRSETIYKAFSEFIGEKATLKDKITFCKIFCLKNNIKSIFEIQPFSDSVTSVTPGSHGKISFVRNDYNDMAFDCFSRSIPHSKAVYFSNFEECCEAISDGSVEFTIFPIENTSDGKMFSFYTLMDRYDLKICAICNIDCEALSKIVTFALVGKRFISENIEKTNSKKSQFFEFSLSCDTEANSHDIFSLSSEFGAKVIRASSLSLHYSTNMTRFYYTFALSENTDLMAFLTYLWLEYPQYNPIGLFREL